jgi:hypothetical protein
VGDKPCIQNNGRETSRNMVSGLLGPVAECCFSGVGTKVNMSYHMYLYDLFD